MTAVAVLCRLVEALTPFDIKETFIYKLAEERHPEIIAAVYNGKKMSSSDTVWKDIQEKFHKFHIKLCEKTKTGNIEQRRDADDFAREFCDTWHSHFLDEKIRNNWIPNLMRFHLSKDSLRLHSLRYIGCRSTNDRCSSTILEDNIGVLIYAGVITADDDYVVRQLSNIELTFNDVYRYFHELIYGSLEEQMRRLSCLDNEIKSLRAANLEQLKQLEAKKDSEREAAIAALENVHAEEQSKANHRIEDLENELQTTKQTQEQLTVSLEDTKAKNKDLSAKVFLLEQENSKLKTQLKSIFSIRDSLDETSIDLVSKVSEHDERLNVVESVVELHDEQLQETD